MEFALQMNCMRMVVETNSKLAVEWLNGTVEPGRSCVNLVIRCWITIGTWYFYMFIVREIGLLTF